MSKVVILTGGTSGIGRATVELLRAQGCTVYEFSRREDGVDPRVKHIQADVTDEEQVAAAVQSVFGALVPVSQWACDLVYSFFYK